MKGKICVAVAGNIGSGKSSLTRLLSEHYGWKALYESVEDNPYLADFYLDMNRWSFNLQVYFLSKRFKDHKRIVEGTESVIQDRSIYEDAEIFVDRPVLDDALGPLDDPLMVFESFREEINLEIERPPVHIEVKVREVRVILDRLIQRLPPVMLAEKPGQGRLSGADVP